jgi:C4-type Zn-finger protein
MKSLTEAQVRRLDAAAARVDELAANRRLHIENDDALTAIVVAIHAAVSRLEAGRAITVIILDEDGNTVASAPLVLETGAGR